MLRTQDSMEMLVMASEMQARASDAAYGAGAAAPHLEEASAVVVPPATPLSAPKLHADKIARANVSDAQEVEAEELLKLLNDRYSDPAWKAYWQ